MTKDYSNLSVNSNNSTPWWKQVSNRQQENYPISLFGTSESNEGGQKSSSNSLFDKPNYNQFIEGDSTYFSVGESYSYGNEDDPSLSVMRISNPISGERIDNVNVKITPRVNVYNSDSFDNQGRLTQRITGFDFALYEEKAKNEETGNDEIKNRIGVFTEYQNPQLGAGEPTVIYGLSYKAGNSTFKPIMKNNGARELGTETQIGATSVKAEFNQEGLNKASLGGEVGHRTQLEGGKDGKYGFLKLRHQKGPKGKTPVTETAQVKVKKGCWEGSYNVNNKDITNWGLSIGKQNDDFRIGTFVNFFF